jgi:hypothetical protein
VTAPADRRRVVRALVEEQRSARLARGVPVLDEAALAADVEAAVARAERTDPQFLARAAARLRAEAAGRRLTFCRLARGTHGGTYVYDPHGTDEPPEWWSLTTAVRIARRRPAASPEEAAATRGADAEAAREAVTAILQRLRARPPAGDVSAATSPGQAPERPVRRRLALG